MSVPNLQCPRCFHVWEGSSREAMSTGCPNCHGGFRFFGPEIGSFAAAAHLPITNAVDPHAEDSGTPTPRDKNFGLGEAEAVSQPQKMQEDLARGREEVRRSEDRISAESATSDVRVMIEKLRVELSQHRSVDFRNGAIYALDELKQQLIRRQHEAH